MSETRYHHRMRFTVELDREMDGRWIAEVLELPGVLAYGPTRAEALAAVKALALRALADKIEHGEIGGDLSDFSFLAA
jgi:predicted RNase H-like HicB family nuclease